MIQSPRPATQKPAVAEKPSDILSRPERFDRTPYEPLPVMDLGDAIALATALNSAKPGGATPAVTEEAARMIVARDRAQTVLQSHLAVFKVEDLRPFDVSMDRAWATLVRRVGDHTEVSAERNENAARAAEIYEVIKGVTILKLDYFNEHTQITARLGLLEKNSMLSDVRELAGGVFLDNALFCLGEYGRAQGITVAKPDDPSRPRDRGEARLALVDQLGEYVAQLLPLARAGRSDTWEFVRKALMPIVDLRARQAARAKTVAPLNPAAPPADPTTLIG